MIATAITTNVRSSIIRFKSTLRQKLDRKIENALAALFQYALSKYSVQLVIADTFDGATPMCRVLRKYIEDGMEGIEVDADNVHGLERAIEAAVEVSDRDLQRDVKEAIDDQLSDIADAVIEEMADRLRK